MSTLRPALPRLTQLLIGLFLYGVATALIVQASVGVVSWSVLTQGLQNLVPWSFGTLTFVISFVVLLLWFPLRQRPGLGTVLNVLLVGLFADLTFAVVPEPQTLPGRILVFTVGLVLLAVATACYIGPGYGTGPRDGLMLGIHERFGLPIWKARTLIEVSVVLVGWALGGDLGVGTVVATLAIGPLVHPLIPLFARPAQPAQAEETQQTQPAERVRESADAGVLRP
ncbi:YitT family protein [Kineosporia rhizophila]|uniref:membrane protein YczE n=1 Tax=Kineosporia rhizophila TaxID=84633 RepID=UPI001E595170|nr:YitT family protein [Kineosporia rhizophila]MCE0535284.1 YitT family protein [Kineosporia rhizophila]